MDYLDYFLAIVVIVGIIFAAGFTTRFVAGKAAGFAGRGKSNIQVLDRQSLSKDKQLLIVSVGERLYFVGVSNQEITLLDRLEGETLDFNRVVPIDAAAVKFQDILKKAGEYVKGGRPQ
jgi:flagellar biosynthetic protein FliO